MGLCAAGLLEVMIIMSGATGLSSLQTDVARNAAKGFAASQLEKLRDAGALDLERPIKIRAERFGAPADDEEQSQLSETKIIHFQRHGQGYHNLLGDVYRELQLPIDMDSPSPIKNPFVRPEILDSPLTETGRQQCLSQRAKASCLSPELVVVSPLQRAIQTAQLSFVDHMNGEIPWIAHEGCREELGLLTCNKRRPLSEIRQDFSGIDFSFMRNEQDEMFHDDRRETSLEKSDRVYQFLVDFIRTRSEEEIAVVGHSAWLFNMCNAVMDCGGDEHLISWFLTSEIRSMRVSFSHVEPRT